jgi:hypothetical protein
MGTLWTFNKYVTTWGLSSTPLTLTLACDNDAALHYALNKERYNDIECTFPDFDILQQIRNLMLPNVQYLLQEVRGHQETLTTALTHWEHLNVLMDSQAKDARATLDTATPPTLWQPALPTPHWIVRIQDNQQQLCKHLPTSLYDYVSTQNMASHWDHLQRIPSAEFRHSDWIALGHAMKATTFHRRMWLTKHAAGNCGVNYIRKRRKEIDSDKCPRCEAIETPLHVWLCKHAQANDIWETSLHKLEVWLRTSTSDNITDQLIPYL